ncbi:type II toxin-antitoxin system RelB/DinJ family antitoxin [Azotobacter beijerinckii]|uniref:RelB antitoxin n=1 Tax=Azotobacter beijerinckii TaxID=170623 RepID=A0A1I4JCJ6_9GAMM|nr:type II toxin-antitoxin system RelB/DinJ family antitoxin [Azotobacter beijerinckii]SFB65477.1 RelB antitoxin [Azotobacter beijerinckii]SFL63951.1 RelB antitoxin [Azotobacter beijerinckii]
MTASTKIVVEAEVDAHSAEAAAGILEAAGISLAAVLSMLVERIAEEGELPLDLLVFLGESKSGK